jgi:hypothetical protein
MQMTIAPRTWAERSDIMRYILDFFACAAIVIWLVEYIGYGATGNVHLLLLGGVLLFVARIFLALSKKAGAIKD